jgi:hypothetical protein
MPGAKWIISISILYIHMYMLQSIHEVHIQQIHAYIPTSGWAWLDSLADMGLKDGGRAWSDRKEAWVGRHILPQARDPADRPAGETLLWLMAS